MEQDRENSVSDPQEFALSDNHRRALVRQGVAGTGGEPLLTIEEVRLIREVNNHLRQTREKKKRSYY